MKNEEINKSTILIVDDKIETLDLLFVYLEKFNLRLMVARSGGEMFDLLKRAIPDMILLDVRMPDMDGFEACRCLKENNDWKEIPVIFMTALSDTINKVTGFEVGAVDYITKPFEKEELLARIKTHLTIERLRKELQTKNKELWESQQNFRTIADYTYDCEIWEKPDKTVHYVSPACERITGYAPDEFIDNPDLLSEIVFSEDRKNWEKLHELVRTSHESNVIQFRIRRKDGRTVWVETANQPVIDDNGEFLGIRASQRDVTKRKKHEEQIKELASERKVLLDELLHRVKNNFAIAISLLRLQSKDIKDPDALKIFEQSTNRLLSISALHDMLHNANRVDKIQMKLYFTKIIENLCISFNIDSTKLNVKTSIENFDLNSKLATPLGLILTELFTNAYKYGFSEENREGEILVNLRRINKDKLIELVVYNSGKKMSEDLFLGQKPSMGIRLVKILVEDQLGGEIKQNSKNGTEFRIKFKE